MHQERVKPAFVQTSSAILAFGHDSTGKFYSSPGKCNNYGPNCRPMRYTTIILSPYTESEQIVYLKPVFQIQNIAKYGNVNWSNYGSDRLHYI